MSGERVDYDYLADFSPREGAANGTPDSMASRPLTVEFKAALESAKWDWVSRNPQPVIRLDQFAGTLVPSWDTHRGRPYLDGLKVLWNGDAGQGETTIPLDYFHDAAQRAAAELVEAGQLTVGAAYSYRVRAVPRPKVAPSQRDDSPLQVETVPTSLPLVDGSISDHLARSCGADDLSELGFSVFLSRAVAEQMRHRTTAATAAETGGILIGHLYLDRTIPEIYLAITAQIPAVHAQQELDSLTLTPATWTAVAATVQQRGAGEQLVGWWHSHPIGAWCAACPEQKRRHCSLQCDFFSAQDRSLHRCCFPRGFQVAVVLSDRGAGDVSTAMYGWHQGCVRRRGFRILEPDTMGWSPGAGGSGH